MKRTLSMLLALIMVLSLVPFGAFAEQTLELTIGKNTAVLDGSDAGLEYTWEAPENGTLTVTMPEDAQNGWEYSVVNSNITGSVKTYYSDGYDAETGEMGEIQYSLTMEVTQGDLITVWVNTLLTDFDTMQYPAGEVIFTAAFESAQGSESQPIDIVDDNTEDGNVITMDIAVPVGKTMYYRIYKIQNMILDVAGEGNFTVKCGEMSAASAEGLAQLEGLTVASIYEPLIISVTNDGYSALSAQMKFYFPVGNYNNPEVLESLGDMTTELEAGNAEGYYYKWTANKAGTVSVNIDMAKESLTADAVLTNLSSGQSMRMTEDGEEIVFGDELTYTKVTLDVANGDVIYIAISAIPVNNSYPEMTVVSTAYFTAIEGTEENPILLEAEDTLTLAAGETVYCSNVGNVNGMIFTMSGGDATVVHKNADDVEVTYTSTSGVTTIPCTQADTNTPAVFVITNTGSSQVTYDVAFTAPVGTWDNPQTLELNKATTANIEANSNGYFFTWTAEEEGIFTLTVNSATKGWVYTISNDISGATTDEHNSAKKDEYGEPIVPVSSDSIEVWPGDTLIISVNTYNSANPSYVRAGSVTVTGSFEACELGDRDLLETEGLIATVFEETVTAEGYSVELNTENPGTLTVTVGDCTPGWRYKIFSDGYESIYYTKWSASHEHKLAAGNWQIVFYAYNSSLTENVEGVVSFDMNFILDEEGGEVELEEYAVDYNHDLAVGNNNLTLLETAITTIYEFTPAEMGVYTFTAPAGVTLGYWGAGEWFLSDPGSTTNTYEWTCTGVGQSAYIGVSGAEGQFVLNVTKTGEYNPVVYTEVEYVNKAKLSAFTVPEGAVLGDYVDVAGSHTPVLGADGYYHLDSVDGPILLVDLNRAGATAEIKLSNKLSSEIPTMFMYTQEQLADGTYIKYSIANAILAYEAVMDANGYYPLTEDLILFYRDYATAQGIWSFNGVTGESDWMYCFLTMTVPSEPEVQKFNLKGSSMTLGNTLEINFAVAVADITGENNYIVVSKEYADGSVVSKTYPQAEWTAQGKTVKYVSFSVTAKEMNDQLTVIVYNENGQQISNTYIDSVAGYCQRKLNEEEKRAAGPRAKYLTLYVDMLNYGAAAQQKWTYNVDALANAELTETQKGYATVIGEKANILQKGDGYKGTSLSLKDNILLNVAFNTSFLTDVKYAEVNFVSHNGVDKSVTVAIEDFIAQGSTTKYISIDVMAVADYAQPVTVKLYNTAGECVSTTIDSMGSYAGRQTKEVYLYEAILAFGMGAWNYFHG